MSGTGRRISSDTAAKVSSVAVVVGVVIVGILAVAGVALLSSFDVKQNYELVITIEDMEVRDDRGYVYDVCMNTSTGAIYYNPHTGYFDTHLTSPSTKALLYTSATIGNTTNYSNNVAEKTVQTTGPAESATPLDDCRITFRFSTSASSVDVGLFLLIKGSGTSEYGTVADIYEKAAGENGVKLTVDLREGIEKHTFNGNPQSKIIGLLKCTIEVKNA